MNNIKPGNKIKLINVSDKTFYTSSKVGDIGTVNFIDQVFVYINFINDELCDKKWKIKDVELINTNNFKLLNYNHY